MEINNISSYEIIEMLWQKLPNNGLGGGKVFVIVDTEDGEVFVSMNHKARLLRWRKIKRQYFI